MANKLFLAVLRILLGLLFVFSGYLKLYPIEPFELNFIDLGISNWYTAPFVARLLISSEFLLGLLLVFNLVTKKFTLPATIVLLIIFSLYLLVQLVREGNGGNCGCFGTFLQMTPLESLLKNAMLLSIAWFLFSFHGSYRRKFSGLIISVFVMVSLITPFILNPVDLMAASQRQPQSVNFPFDFSLLRSDTLSNELPVELLKGRHIVAFFSMTCQHCKTTAFKMHVIEKRHPEVPFFMVLNGKEKSLKPFFEETKAENIPYMILLGAPFAKITAGNVPTIYWMEDGIVVRKSLYISLEEEEILKWLKDP